MVNRSYLTGRGFIGNALIELHPFDYEITHIPHQDIATTEILPFDTFFFFSSYGNMADHTDEEAMYKANILDLISVLQRVKDIDFKSFVFLSTSSVKLRTQTTYSRFKRAAEEILLAFMERHNKPVCIVRPLSVTGIGEQEAHLIPALIRSAMEGTQINFVSEPVHDFIDVHDLVQGLLSLSRNSARGVYELGTGIKYTNQQVLETVEKVTGKKIKTNIIKSLREYDTTDWVSTNFKARGFGWMPTKSLETSISEMVKDYGTKRI